MMKNVGNNRSGGHIFVTQVLSCYNKPMILLIISNQYYEKQYNHTIFIYNCAVFVPRQRKPTH